MAFDVSGGRDAQHNVVRTMKIGICIAGRVRCHERKAASVSHGDQVGLGCRLGWVPAPRHLDVEAIGEQFDQSIDVAVRCRMLPFGQQPGQRPLTARSERDETIAVAGEPVELDVRLFVYRAPQMGRRNQRTQILIATQILSIKRQPVIGGRRSLRPVGPRDTQHRRDDRLHAFLGRCLAKRHHTIEPVAVANCRGRKSHVTRLGGNILWIDSSFEHRVCGENPKRNELRVRHEKH